MIFTIKDGKLFNEAGKSIPFTKLSGLTIEKIHKVKAGKEKDAIKLSLGNQVRQKQPEAETVDNNDYYEQESGQNKGLARTEPIRPKGPNKFLQMTKIKLEPEPGFNKVNDNVQPVPRLRGAADNKKYSVTCHACGKACKVPAHEVPPTIEGEQMSYRCNGCCKR